jgi:hypothetical protein
MQNLRNKLIAGGAVLLLAAIGTMMNRQAMQAAGGPSVTIESPIPLPVTGTVTAAKHLSQWSPPTIDWSSNTSPGS